MSASILSMMAAVIYVATAMLALLAARSTKFSGAKNRHHMVWCIAAALFLMLAAMRMAGFEDVMQSALRDLLSREFGYAERRRLQWPLMLGGAIIFGMIVVWQLRSMLSGGLPASLRERAVIVVKFALMAMMALVALRTVSLRATDFLLYGPLKLNWFADLGLTVTVALSAIFYWQRSRKRRR